MFTGSEKRRVSSSSFNSPQILSYDLGGNTPYKAMKKLKVRNGCRPVRLGGSHLRFGNRRPPIARIEPPFWWAVPTLPGLCCVQLFPQHSPQCLLIYWTSAQIFPQRQINKRLITHPLFFRSRLEGLKHIIIQHDSDARLSGPQSIKMLHLGGACCAGHVVFTLHRLAAPSWWRVSLK